MHALWSLDFDDIMCSLWMYDQFSDWSIPISSFHVILSVSFYLVTDLTMADYLWNVLWLLCGLWGSFLLLCFIWLLFLSALCHHSLLVDFLSWSYDLRQVLECTKYWPEGGCPSEWGVVLWCWSCTCCFSLYCIPFFQSYSAEMPEEVTSWVGWD